MNHLIEHITATGELEKYWQSVEKENDQAKWEARKVEKQRKRVEMGDAYISSGGEEPSDKADSWDNSTS